ncbi:hypothetical protein OW763_11860 [Clostridium aestuarii]|uniref:Cyclic lactone autoinducer peptide n=1 Tax=Clostridium aestuarii TaxID=338193 RepID=A0ABT4D1B4_9CLOT|nr:hypothetical protein [Clostridium aestuarii]MCY6485036.1 hypothetical protein [Clostridium aestuarii]
MMYQMVFLIIGLANLLGIALVCLANNNTETTTSVKDDVKPNFNPVH